jgi:hypothetical protein
LQILTKEPRAASEAGQGKKYPVPRTLDPVLAQAFKKMAALRPASVGALADGVGRAYGLTGDHRAWAMTREADLAAQIEARMPELMAAAAGAGGAPQKTVADDFFGESAALGNPGDSLRPLPPSSAAPNTNGAVTVDSLVPAGVPRRSVPLLLLVGGAALVLGVLVVVVLMLFR